jgi:hypothetical protein
MAQRHEPQLQSLIYDRAYEAEHVMRTEAANSHQGQERDRSSDRPDRFTHPLPPVANSLPCPGGVHRLS